MADVITRFKLETSQFDSKLRDTAKALQGIAHQAALGGKDFNDFNQKAIESARALGTVQSGANNTKDKLRDLVGSYNDAAKAYNSLTETAKKGEFGQAMSQSLTQLQQRIRETKEELYGLGDGMKGASGGSLFSSDKLSGMLQVFGGNLMTKGAGMVMSFAGEMKDMVAQGIELAKAGEGVRLAFQRLGRGDILDGLREATHGTVTDLELMKAAVKFNDFKLPLDELGTMLAFAQQKAKDTGQSVDYMVESITNGLGRKSLMILDNLGLSAAEIKEKMAETGDMTKAVGAIIREQMQKAGDYVETAADRAAQANVSLQNKMEELGRKFAPIEEASNQLWTSMKIGILDVVGGPLADLLNGLTRAGQLRNELKNIGSDDRVKSDVEKLKGSNYKPQAYQMMLAKYSREEQQALDNYKKAQKGGMGSIAIWENRYLARKSMREDFQARGREIAYPATDKPTPTVVTKTTGGTSTTTTTTTKQTPQQRAQESFTKAEQNYKQALEQAAMELQAGTITRAEAKKKEMQAAEARWRAIGDARNINDSENLRQAQDEAAAEYKRLAAEAKTATEHQKAVDKATRDLENANQKLATARQEMAQAKQQGDLQAYNTAKDKATAAQKEITRLEKVKVDVKTGRVDLPDIPKVIEQTVNTHQGELMTAEIAKEITQTINTRLGRIVTPDILESITQTINTKVGNVITPEIAKEVTQVVNVETGRVDLPDIPKVIEQTVNTHQGELMTAEIAKEITQTINTRLGRIVTPEILDEVTQTINTKVGNVITPEIAKEVTQVVNVETGRVDLPDIPKVIEQTVNTHQGELMTAEIAKEITQTINTRFGRIVTPDILESITQTINTKVGNVITPEIAKEVTHVVNVETGRVDLPDIPATTTTTVDFEANTRNIDAAISYVKKEMDTIPVGTIDFNLDQTKLADLTTLKTLISEQMKNGLQIDPNFAQSMFSNILAGKDIENTTWQAQVDNINKYRTDNGLDPLKIDYKTGEKENGKETKKLTEQISTLTSGLSSIAGGLKGMGIVLPEEVDQVIGVIQGVTSVIEGVNAIISIFSTSAMSANTAALIANTIALNVNTATSFIPFANGGVVPTFAQGGLIGRAAGGMMIPGNSMSGDRLRLPVDGGRGMIGVNSGELILNRAQQGNIASQLEGGVGAMQLSAIITGEQLRLVLNNNGRRTGRGEYVTTNFR